MSNVEAVRWGAVRSVACCSCFVLLRSKVSAKMLTQIILLGESNPLPTRPACHHPMSSIIHITFVHSPLGTGERADVNAGRAYIVDIILAAALHLYSINIALVGAWAYAMSYTSILYAL